MARAGTCFQKALQGRGCAVWAAALQSKGFATRCEAISRLIRSDLGSPGDVNGAAACAHENRPSLIGSL